MLTRFNRLAKNSDHTPHNLTNRDSFPTIVSLPIDITKILDQRLEV